MVPGMFPVKSEVELSLHSGGAGLGFKFKIPDTMKSH